MTFHNLAELESEEPVFIALKDDGISIKDLIQEAEKHFPTLNFFLLSNEMDSELVKSKRLEVLAPRLDSRREEKAFTEYYALRSVALYPPQEVGSS